MEVSGSQPDLQAWAGFLSSEGMVPLSSEDYNGRTSAIYRTNKAKDRPYVKRLDTVAV